MVSQYGVSGLFRYPYSISHLDDLAWAGFITQIDSLKEEEAYIGLNLIKAMNKRVGVEDNN